LSNKTATYEPAPKKKRKKALSPKKEDAKSYPPKSWYKLTLQNL
jgi:hypothetical protein